VTTERARTSISAYDTSYSPNSALPNGGLDLNWLGDTGTSGNFFGTDPLFFQVLVPAMHNLLLVVNNTAPGDLGVGDPFHLLVEGFIDTEYTDPAPPPVPEPATMFLTASGLAVLAARRRVRKRR
jgi:hypothetical protein